jgi:hypothetical protein
MSDVQIAVIDQQDTQIALAVPGIQGPVGEGVPSGGTTNQVLFKQSGTNYDTAWSAVTSAMIGDLQIADADVAANAEIAVSKLADGSARQLLQTDAAGTGVEWTNSIDVPGTLDVTGATTLDSTLTVPLGSAAAPTLHFTGDTNTGIYSPGADQVAISTNGTGRLFVDASGNVTVDNIASSIGFFNARKAGAADQVFHIENRTTASGLDYNVAKTLKVNLVHGGKNSAFDAGWQLNSGCGSGVATNNGYLAISKLTTQDGSSSSEVLRIDSSGRLGIGTTSPATTLDVNGDVTITDKIIHGGDTNTAIRFPAADTVSVETGGSERARIDTSGRLLVGTSTARSNLRSGVYGSVGQIETAGTNAFAFIQNATTEQPCRIVLAKQKSGSTGGNTSVADTDGIGSIEFLGNDGTNFIQAATIFAAVDGTPGTGDMPGRLVFATTADGAASPTERMRIDSTGLMTLAGPGIKFPATAVASADPNTLDDYEEGTFTPTLQFGGASTGITYTTRAASYTKIGRCVTIVVQLLLSNKGSSTGTATVAGLPFTSASIGTYSCYAQALVFADMLIFHNTGAATTITMRETTNAGVVTELADTDFANNTLVYLTGHYEV